MKKWRTAVALFLLLGIVGCGQNNNTSQQGANDNNHSKYMEVKQSVQEPNSRKRQNLNSQAIARHLVQVAENVPHVRDATAVVTMGYAVIGIDVDKDLDRSRIGAIKYSVTEALRNDRYGANAVVISDPDTVQRLKNMGKSIRNGRPVSGILGELSQIVGRVMPQVPGNMNNVPNPQKKMPQQQKSRNGHNRPKKSQATP